MLRCASGSFWLTIPINRESTKGRIYDATVSDLRWANKHLISVREALSGLKDAAQLIEPLTSEYRSFADEHRLHNINLRLIRAICNLASISTPIVFDTQVATAELLAPSTDPTLRLVNICKGLGATTYLTGSRAMEYLDLDQFRKASISVEVADYSKLPVYRQKYEGFQPNVSVLDYLAAVGLKQASDYLNSGNLGSTVVA